MTVRCPSNGHSASSTSGLLGNVVISKKFLRTRKIMVMGDDTPPQIDEFERLEVEGGGVGAALEEYEG